MKNNFNYNSQLEYLQFSVHIILLRTVLPRMCIKRNIPVRWERTEPFVNKIRTDCLVGLLEEERSEAVWVSVRNYRFIIQHLIV